MKSYADLDTATRDKFLAFVASEAGEPVDSGLAEFYAADPAGQEFTEDFAKFLRSGNPAEATPAPVAPDVSADDFIPLSIARATKLVTRAERGRTRSNLGVAAELALSIEHTMLTVCTAHEDTAQWREDTIGRFTKPISLAMSQTLTTRKLAEFLKIRYMTEALPGDVQAKADRVNWESLRTLARWVTFLPGETTFERGEVYVEEWMIATGCEAKLADLVTTLASKPQSASDLRKALDAHETTLGIAKPGKPTIGRQQRIADLVQSIRKDSAALGLDLSKPAGLATLAEWLLDDGCLTVQAVVSAATTINARHEPSQANKRATVTVDALPATSNPDTLKHPAAQTRVISTPLPLAKVG